MKVTFDNTENNEKLVLIEGEINTITAKELEKELDDKVSMTDDLVLDFEKVPYISSAGLRVLMKMQKETSKLGSMKLIHVNDDVLEVLKMVRLDKVLSVEGSTAGNVTEAAESEYDFSEYELKDEDIEKLLPRVKQLYQQDKLKGISASLDGDLVGFAVYEIAKSGQVAYVLYIYVNEDARGKGVASSLVARIQNILADQNIKELCLACLTGTDGSKLASKLGFVKTKNEKFILKYTKKQILDSPMWKQIDKLRNMFDKIKILDELDYMAQMQLEQLMGDDDFEDIDPLYARILVEDEKVVGLLNAQEVTENNIWISKVTVLPSKSANFAPVLMLGSLVDAVAVLLEDDDNIQVVNANEKMMKSFEQVLGQPLDTFKDTFYIKQLS